jgi:uncharacterized protein
MDYQAEVEVWRQDMDTQMRSPGPGGWLAVVGMYPLKQGANTIGSSVGSDVLLPKAAPEKLGMLEFEGIRGALTITTDELVTVDDTPTKYAVLRNYYEPGGMSVVKVRDVRFGIMQWASDPYNIRVWDANSPKRLNFLGRTWFPVDATYRVTGTFTPYEEVRDMTVTHTGGDMQILKSPGVVEFSLLGQSFRFEAATSEKGADYVWLLARDATNGESTYGAGRFLMAPLSSNSSVELDFNKFYHPPCAFCDFTTCPVPPKGNEFPFKLEAGERFPESRSL